MIPNIYSCKKRPLFCNLYKIQKYAKHVLLLLLLEERSFPNQSNLALALVQAVNSPEEALAQLAASPHSQVESEVTIPVTVTCTCAEAGEE